MATGASLMGPAPLSGVILRWRVSVPIIQLYRLNEEYLSSHDAIRRIAPAFRHVILDRARGEAEYRKEWDKVKSLNAPEAILQTYSLANCRTVWVEVADNDGADGWVRFPLWSRRDIFIEFSSAAEYTRLRPTVEKLAMVLGYVAEDGAAQGDRVQSGEVAGDVVFRFSFAFRPHANPPGLKERFEKALGEFLGARGFDFGLAGIEGKTYTRGFVRGKDRPVTREDREAFAQWAMGQRIKCTGLLGSLEDEVDVLDLFDDKGGWGFVVDNLLEEDRAEAAACREVADRFVRPPRE
jgi:hypothetical protein